MLLPALLVVTNYKRLTVGRPTFIEMGAHDGISTSNTLLLERCCNWTGVLIEGHPDNFAKLQQSGRSSVKVHSAVCSKRGTVRMTSTAGVFANAVGMGKHVHRHASGKSPPVPCDTLTQLLSTAHQPHTIDFFSLDVEGGEEHVLLTLDASRIRLLAVEMDKLSRTSKNRTVTRLNASGLRPAYAIGPNEIWVQPELKRYTTDLRWSARCQHAQHCRQTFSLRAALEKAAVWAADFSDSVAT